MLLMQKLLSTKGRLDFQRVTLYQSSNLDLSDKLVSFTGQLTTLGVVDIT